MFRLLSLNCHIDIFANSCITSPSMDAALQYTYKYSTFMNVIYTCTVLRIVVVLLTLFPTITCNSPMVQNVRCRLN